LELFKPRRGEQVPVADVQRRIEKLAQRYHGAQVFIDPSQMLKSIQELTAKGVRVEEQRFTTRTNDEMATVLHTMLRDGLIDLPADNEELLDELRQVRMVEKAAGLLSIDTRSGGHDDQVDALGIVVTNLMRRSARGSLTGSSAQVPPIPYRRDGGDGMFNPRVGWGDGGTPEWASALAMAAVIYANAGDHRAAVAAVTEALAHAYDSGTGRTGSPR
jgi:Terminase RNaseH-like domain